MNKNTIKPIWTIFLKECIDNLRDRRSVFSAISSSLVGPLLILLMVVIIGKTVFNEQIEKSLEIPVIGVENAPDLVQFLEQNNITLFPAPSNPEEAVKNGDEAVVLVIPDTYQEDFRQGMPATIQLIADSSRQSTMASVERLRRAINAYDNQIATMRLMARGISPTVISPLAIENLDVSTPQSQGLIFLNILPYFIVMVTFLGGMYVIIDTTAGERERGSLEPLLINPVPRWQIVIGKLLASIPFALLAIFLCLVGFWVVFNAFPLEDYIGFQLSVSPVALAGIFLISIPMTLLASGLQMVIATFTRSFKEAQTYVSFLPLIPAIPGMALAFLPVKASLWTMLIPTFGQQILINQLMRGETLSAVYLWISTLITLLVAGILIFIAILLYQRERVIFGVK
jgi:sodium transport system permease protein